MRCALQCDVISESQYNAGDRHWGHKMAIKNVLLVGSALALTACGASSPVAFPETHEAGASHPAVSATVAATASGPVDPLAVCEGVGPDGDPVEVQVNTVSYAFDPQQIEGPRHCQPFVITFTNSDRPGLVVTNFRHDIDIHFENFLGDLVFDGQAIGNTTIRYEVPGLPAGEHYFYCTVHPEMSGRVVVTP